MENDRMELSSKVLSERRVLRGMKHIHLRDESSWCDLCSRPTSGSVRCRCTAQEKSEGITRADKEVGPQGIVRKSYGHADFSLGNAFVGIKLD